MKRASPCKLIIVFGTICTIFIVFVLAFLFKMMVQEIVNGEIVYSIILGYVLSIFILFLYVSILVLNRGASRVYYDSTKNMLYRKGFICGYKFKLKVEDIIKIYAVEEYKVGNFYIIMDPYSTQYDFIYYKSCIRIPKNKRNYIFIKQFWDKQIVEN